MVHTDARLRALAPHGCGQEKRREEERGRRADAQRDPHDNGAPRDSGRHGARRPEGPRPACQVLVEWPHLVRVRVRVKVRVRVRVRVRVWVRVIRAPHRERERPKHDRAGVDKGRVEGPLGVASEGRSFDTGRRRAFARSELRRTQRAQIAPVAWLARPVARRAASVAAHLLRLASGARERRRRAIGKRLAHDGAHFPRRSELRAVPLAESAELRARDRQAKRDRGRCLALSTLKDGLPRTSLASQYIRHAYRATAPSSGQVRAHATKRTRS